MVSHYSPRRRTSNGVRSFPLVGWNLLPHLNTHFRNILSDKCLNLLFEVKCISQDGCLQIWQNPRWLLPWQKKKNMWHGCKHSSSWDNTRTVCCTEQDYIFLMSYRVHRWTCAIYVPSRYKCCSIQILCTLFWALWNLPRSV